MIYRSAILNNICECVEESGERFHNDWDHISSTQILYLLIDKFGLDNFLMEYEFNEVEYKKYFKVIAKNYSSTLHKEIKEEFKKGHKN